MPTATSRPGAPAPPAFSPKRWPALLVALAAVFMDLVDLTVVLVALPSIERTLGAGEAALQWTVAGYSLTFALLLITGGRLGDIVGRKRVFVTGLAGFTLASLLAGVAPSAGMLVAARVLQGGMAALMVPQVLSFIQVEFPASERPRAFAVLGMTFALGGVSGPLLGGLLLQADLFGWGWRTIFLINLPIGITALAGATWLLRESKSDHAPRLDPGGTALVTIGLLALLYPLVQGHELNWPAWTVVSSTPSAWDSGRTTVGPVKPPPALPSSTITWPDDSSATARSGSPSWLNSPTATAAMPVPLATVVGALKVPSEPPTSTERVPASWSATTKSGSPSWLKSPTATT
jgi:MFS family permease